ncbi:hypothetical protein FRC01_007947, partial [Tulasnella sp. 417]
ARLDINAKSSEFPKDLQEEVSERFLLEYDKDIREQQRRQSKRVKASAPLSPQFPPDSFQRLPPEIIFEIIPLAQVFNPHAHITLSQVNGSLRSLVNSTPRLWSRVDFLYPLPVVHTYLERSADTLLRVTALPPLHIGAAHHPLLEDVKRDEYNKMMQFFRALRPHRHRILSLCLRSDDLLFDLADESDGQSIPEDFLGDGSMVNLEILDLELSMWPWMGLEDIPPSDSIRELRLRGPWTTDYMPFFSTHLKFLVITNNIAPFHKILDALHTTPCLTSLTFLDMAFTETQGKERAILTFEQLESLSLIRVFGSAAEALGECIVAPNLVSFTFQHASILYQVQDRKDINELQFFPAPQPSVRRLDLTGCNARPSFFNSVFRTFPCITHLRIASSNLTDDHLVGAVVKPVEDGEPGLTTLPDLKHLTIDNEFDRSLICALRQIAYSRHSWGRRMESMTLRGIPVDSDAALDDLESIAGLVSLLEVGGFDQDLDVYGDSDDSASETSSEGEWASGDDEVLAAYQKLSIENEDAGDAELVVALGVERDSSAWKIKTGALLWEILDPCSTSPPNLNPDDAEDKFNAGQHCARTGTPHHALRASAAKFLVGAGTVLCVLSTSETPDYDPGQKKALDTLRRSFYPDIIVADLETDQLMKLYWPTLDEDGLIPVACERYNEHRLTHQTHRIGCHCSILGGPKALAKVFLVNKPGQWTGWFVMGCGSYRTHPTGGCGFFAPLGKKDSEVNDREFFKPRINGDIVPLHYYPPHGAAPSPPPLQIISKPSSFGTPQVLQVGGPGSSLYGAMGPTLETRAVFDTHDPPRYRTPARRVPALRMKEEEADPVGSMPHMPFDDPFFVVPATGYSTTGYHRDSSGVLTGPLTAAPTVAVPPSRANTATVTPPPSRIKVSTPPPPRIKSARFSPYPEMAESTSGLSHSTIESKSKGKAKAPARTNLHPFSIYTRFVAHDGTGISRRELGEIIFTCPDCRGNFAFWVKQAHESICKSLVIDLTADDDD